MAGVSNICAVCGGLGMHGAACTLVALQQRIATLEAALVKGREWSAALRTRVEAEAPFELGRVELFDLLEQLDAALAQPVGGLTAKSP